jgi:arylsulfatase A-like enzyme
MECQYVNGCQSNPHPPAIAEQVSVGSATAVVVAGADLVVAALRSGPDAPAAAWTGAALHLLAMQLPVGVLAGLLVGTALHVLRRAAWFDAVRTKLSDRRRLFAHDANAFAHGAAVLAGGAFFVLAVRVAALHFATRYHAPDLAAWAMAATTVVLLGVAILAGDGVRALLRPLAARMGRAASPGGALLLAALAVLGAGVAVAVAAPRLLRVYDPVAVLWLPGAAAIYFAVAVALRRLWRRRETPPRHVHAAGLVLGAMALGAIVASGATYGRSNAVRSVVEQRTVVGLRLLRFYMDVTDRDRDGYSFAFGGGDCDDADPTVYPGAPDVAGDGVDRDCFAGDGSPNVADFGDGAYGARPEGLTRPNILLVTVDALRADHLGSYGYRRPTSPRLDAFARTAVRFEYVVSQSSRSIRSIPSMMTGFYPSQIAYGPEYLFPALLPENITMAETLREAGYRTAVTMGTNYFERVSGFFQGFDDVEEITLYRPPRSMPVTRALAQLDRLQERQQPWFLWVHLFNVHEEYLWDRTPSKFGDRPVDAYDTEITFADAEVGRLLDAVKSRGLSDDTVVIVTADHGEAFGERGHIGHARTVYEEELRVPLLVRIPGVRPGVSPGPVGLFDLMPTVLNLVGVGVPRPMPARSLVPLLEGGATDPERLLISEVLPDGLYPYDQKAIRRGDMKLHWWVREGTYHLFDLAADPGETRDLSDARRPQAQELLGLLRAWVAQTNRPEQRQHDVVDKNRLDRAPAAMTRRLDVRYPGFTLLGFDLPRTTFAPGERIPMTFYYRVDARMDESLFFYVNITGPPRYRVPPHFHAHHYPMNGRYHTHQWKPGEVLRDPVEMIVPKNIRRPVTLGIDLSIRAPSGAFLPYVGPADQETVLQLAEIHVR